MTFIAWPGVLEVVRRSPGLIGPLEASAQQYLPEELADARYYIPTEHGAEAALVTRLARIEELLGRSDD